jgi:hypothetical protein
LERGIREDAIRAPAEGEAVDGPSGQQRGGTGREIRPAAGSQNKKLLEQNKRE